MTREEFAAFLGQPRLYALPYRRDEDPTAMLRDAEAIAATLPCIIQLRLKHAATGPFVEAAKAWKAALAGTGCPFIVNDRVDVAMLAGADGVHLGQDDLPVAEARKLLPEAILGLSTHTPEQAAAAQSLDLDYLALGPIFATATKDDPDPVVGVEALREVCAASRLPVVAIGGITSENAPECLAAGAKAVCVASDLAGAGDAAQRAGVYRTLLAP